MSLTAADLIAFEDEVARRFEEKEILGPVHLGGGNEDQLIEIFKDIHTDDWVFATYRNHYHALLHGIPAEKVMAQIMAGKSMNLTFPEHRFFTSAIVGGCLPIAVGVALGLQRSGSDRKVWCFCGDMAASTGAFHEAYKFSARKLPIAFIVEDNGLSCDSPTKECWGEFSQARRIDYQYVRKWPHVGIPTFVQF